MTGVYEEIVEIRRRGERAALATIIGRKGSIPRKDAAKMLIRANGSTLGTVGGGCTEGEVWREALTVMREEKAKTLFFELMEDEPTESGLLCGGTMEVYIEPILPDPVVYIFGAGHISKALCRVAAGVGFKVFIVEDRAQYANPQRFPDAEDIVVDEFEKVLPTLSVSDSSYIIIVTRGHAYDQTILQWAVRTDARYIGLLGSRRKIKILYENLEAAGIPRAQLERVCGPIGLEIGSETPEEIAVSIAAELIAARKKIDVQRLKQKQVHWESLQPAPIEFNKPT